MRQTSTLTRTLAENQERAAERRQQEAPLQPNTCVQRVRYRLYAGVPAAHLVPLVAAHFDGASLIDALGRWQGNVEGASTVDIIGTDRDANKVRALALAIAADFQQTAVYVETVSIVLEDVRPVPVVPVLQSVARADVCPTCHDSHSDVCILPNSADAYCSSCGADWRGEE